MEAITIKKAKLNNKGGVDVTYIDTNGNERVLKGVRQIDDSLSSAFLALSPFITELTEQREAGTFDISEVKPLPTRVTGVSRQIGDTEKVQLLGNRTLASGAVIEVNTHALDMETLLYDWDHAKELDKVLSVLYKELENYVSDASAS